MSVNDLGFHDGSLDGFWFSEAGVLHIFLIDHTKTITSTATLEGVIMMRAGEFKAGSIIFSATVRDGDDIAVADLEWLGEDDPEQRRVDMPEAFRERAAAHASKLLVRVKDERLKLFEITRSYGGYLAALAKEVHVLSRREWLDSTARVFGW
jgi:hypothetical protein